MIYNKKNQATDISNWCKWQKSFLTFTLIHCIRNRKILDWQYWVVIRNFRPSDIRAEVFLLFIILTALNTQQFLSIAYCFLQPNQ